MKDRGLGAWEQAALYSFVFHRTALQLDARSCTHLLQQPEVSTSFISSWTQHTDLLSERARPASLVGKLILQYRYRMAHHLPSRKKSRCTGEKPACSHCARLGQHCTYASNTDRVNPNPTHSPSAYAGAPQQPTGSLAVDQALVNSKDSRDATSITAF